MGGYVALMPGTSSRAGALPRKDALGNIARHLRQVGGVWAKRGEIAVMIFKSLFYPLIAMSRAVVACEALRRDVDALYGSAYQDM